MGDVRNHTQWGMILKLTVRCDGHRIHRATYAVGMLRVVFHTGIDNFKHSM